MCIRDRRGRQEQLARERIAARKKKLSEQRAAKENNEEMKLTVEENKDKMDDLSEVEQLQREGNKDSSLKYKRGFSTI